MKGADRDLARNWSNRDLTPSRGLQLHHRVNRDDSDMGTRGARLPVRRPGTIPKLRIDIVRGDPSWTARCGYHPPIASNVHT
jgi:hypothetical protein